MCIHLVGGGWAEKLHPRVYGQFVTEAVQRAAETGRAAARVGIIQLYEGTLSEGEQRAGQFADILSGLGPVRPVPLLAREGEVCPPGQLDDVDGILVAGGLTPAYLSAVEPVADEIRQAVAEGVPYLGFSAGAAIAARRAVIGGWRIGELVIGNEDAAEDLDQLTVADGLGLVDFAVDVHAAQWGNVSRLIMAVTTGAVDRGVALDEGTVCRVDGTAVTVAGAGQAWWVSATAGGVQLRTQQEPRPTGPVGPPDPH